MQASLHSSPMWGHTEHTLLPATKMQQHECDVSVQIGTFENQSQGFYWGLVTKPGVLLGASHKARVLLGASA